MKPRILSKLFKSSRSQKNPKLKGIKSIIGFTPGQITLYEQAFRHNSFVSQDEHKVPGVHSNERLEFLGDAILDSVVAELLFMTFPLRGEGFLTETRAKIVSREKLAELALKIGLDELLQYGKGVAGNKVIIKSLAGNALEALIGAIYIDKGYVATKKFIIRRLFKNHLDVSEIASLELNFKSRLIEWTQKMKKQIEFELVSEKNDHRTKRYEIRVLIDGEEMGRGQDFSKKKAEQQAAQQACELLQVLE